MSAHRETLHAGVSVDFAAIDETLRTLWRNAARPKAESERRTAVRVSTMNLVVLAGSRADAEVAKALAVELCGRRPGRVLIVQAEAGEEKVRAEVSTECFRAGDHREICSEIVHLFAGGRSMLYGSQIVAPLLLADVPVILWLPGHPTLLPVDEDLLQVVDRVVVDARHFPDADTALGQMESWAEGRRVVVDLAWLRLERWRCLSASLFGDADARADLDHASGVEVTYRTGVNDSPEGLVEALYYLSWSALAHGWRLGRGATLEREANGWTVRDHGRTAALALRHAPRGEGEHGDLTSVAMRMGPETTYTIRRTPGLDMAELLIEAPRSCPHPLRVAMPTPPLVDLLARAVAPPFDDETFERVLSGARVLAHAR